MRKSIEAKKAGSRKARAIFLATVMPFAGLTAATSVLAGCPNPTTSTTTTKEPTRLEDFQADDTKIPVYLENGASEGDIIGILGAIWDNMNNVRRKEFTYGVKKIIITTNNSGVSFSDNDLRIAGNSSLKEIGDCLVNYIFSQSKVKEAIRLAGQFDNSVTQG